MAASRRMSVRARKAIAWGLLWFAAGQVAFRLALQARPVLGDPEFGRKLADVKSATGDRPGRPLVLMLGSSRVATGFGCTPTRSAGKRLARATASAADTGRRDCGSDGDGEFAAGKPASHHRYGDGERDSFYC